MYDYVIQNLCWIAQPILFLDGNLDGNLDGKIPPPQMVQWGGGGGVKKFS